MQIEIPALRRFFYHMDEIFCRLLLTKYGHICDQNYNRGKFKPTKIISDKVLKSAAENLLTQRLSYRTPSPWA